MIAGQIIELKEAKYKVEVLNFYEYETRTYATNITLMKVLDKATPTPYIVALDVDFERGSWWQGTYCTDWKQGYKAFKKKVEANLGEVYL